MSTLNKSERQTAILPERTCDVVMKGGITSGIVYPKGIYELSKEYRFINIGGNSAGAIAACLTAAAEYDRRENNSMKGFELLNGLPESLGKVINGKSKLFSLFRPNHSTKKIFEILLKLYETFTGKKKSQMGSKIFNLMHGIIIIIRNYLPEVILTCIPGFAALFYLIKAEHTFLNVLSIVYIFIISFIVIVLVVLFRFVIDFNKSLVKNYFGLTTGYVPGNKKDETSLTEWLSDTINEAAGKGKGEDPLTFGELKNSSGGKFAIDLRMITTNLTWGKPHNLPFTASDVKNSFYYDPIEMEAFFPKKIITWMDSMSRENIKGRMAFPNEDDLPIVVAARMSLCFPGLISAVPLYAADRSLKINSGEKDQTSALEKCLFSDGGICSNFPVHLFDSPLPGRPTFAFNLTQFHPDFPKSEDESKNIYLPDENESGLLYTWNKKISSPVRFFFSIIDTMQNWVDNTQTKIPGYRDRIVRINLESSEGGLNLNMDEDTISRLSERGKFAGIRLSERFTGKDDSGMDWNNHRWVRFRTTFCLIEEHLKKIAKALRSETSPIEKGYLDLLNRNDSEEPRSYKFSKPQREFAQKFVKKISEMNDDLTGGKESFCSNNDAPKPRPELRVRPKI